MDTQNKKCADPILEKLGLGHFYYGDKPLVWIAQPYSAPTSLPKDVRKRFLQILGAENATC